MAERRFSEDEPVMVSIRCITYNHAPYIRQCLDGFVMQKTNFRFQAVVHDDASTDGTTDIVREYAEKYPDIIIPMYEEENRWSKHDGTLLTCMLPLMIGKYWAECEGDDYWIDPYKLQKQVDYMERHPEYGLVHTKARVYNQTQQCFRGLCGRQDSGFEDIILSNPIVTLTTCFRTTLFLQYLKERSEWNVRGWMMSDYPMWIWFAYHTKIYFLDEETAIYREVPNSVSHQSLDNRLRFIKSTEDIRLFFVYYYNLSERVKKEICYETNKKSASACLKYGDKKRAEEYLKELSCLDRWRIKKKYLF